jgi:hypothetical protein
VAIVSGFIAARTSSHAADLAPAVPDYHHRQIVQRACVF